MEVTFSFLSSLVSVFALDINKLFVRSWKEQFSDLDDKKFDKAGVMLFLSLR